MIKLIRSSIKKNRFLRKLFGYYLPSSGLFDSVFRKYTLDSSWKERINYVLSSSDNDLIPKVKDAGLIKRGKQIMHNGLKIHLGSYYGPEYSKMLILSKGIHEPQEERIFGEVLKHMRANATMIEMGAYWSFYSMWFHKDVENAKNFMIEPDEFNLGQGKRNFELNKLSGNFTQAFVGKAYEKGNPDIISVDYFMEKNDLKFIDLLHSDIQGFEVEMLYGATKALKNQLINYIFISTHSNELHYKCIDIISSYEYKILQSIDIDESFSEDGLIVAKLKNDDDYPQIELSRRHTS